MKILPNSLGQNNVIEKDAQLAKLFMQLAWFQKTLSLSSKSNVIIYII